MGSGAPKNFDVIPMGTIVEILAAEGLVDEAFRNMASALGKVFNGGDDWASVAQWRELLFNRTRILTQAVMKLERNQNNV